jgi:hypothetical protein
MPIGSRVCTSGAEFSPAGCITQHSRSENDEIVAMDDFLIVLRAKSLLNLGRFQAFDFGKGVGRTINDLSRILCRPGPDS